MDNNKDFKIGFETFSNNELGTGLLWRGYFVTICLTTCWPYHFLFHIPEKRGKSTLISTKFFFFTFNFHSKAYSSLEILFGPFMIHVGWDKFIKPIILLLFWINLITIFIKAFRGL